MNLTQKKGIVSEILQSNELLRQYYEKSNFIGKKIAKTIEKALQMFYNDDDKITIGFSIDENLQRWEFDPSISFEYHPIRKQKINTASSLYSLQNILLEVFPELKNCEFFFINGHILLTQEEALTITNALKQLRRENLIAEKENCENNSKSQTESDNYYLPHER